MPALTKEQKMEMLSKAIDAGFAVEVKIHRVETMEEVHEKLSIFPEMTVKFHGHKDTQHAWISLNRDKYDDGFEATIYFK